jgi:hypothetical protein
MPNEQDSFDSEGRLKISTSALVTGELKRVLEMVRFQNKEVAITHYGDLVARIVPYDRSLTNPLHAINSAPVPGKKKS